MIQDVEVLMFGHDRCYETRVYVLYDGTHYNLCVDAHNHRTFKPDDERVYQGVLELAKTCKKAGEAIDPAIFSLVCFECNRGLIGQIDAVDHAKQTGHTDFR